MKLNLSNIRSVKIGGVYFGAVNLDVRSYHYRVYTNANDHAIGEIPAKIAPCLEFDGPVWLGVSCYDTADGSFAPGGYLGSVAHAFTFIPKNGDPSESVAFNLLGLVPGPYQGGVKIDGLSLPSSLVENTPAAATGHRYVQIAQGQTYPPIIFNINGSNRYLYGSAYASFDQYGTQTWEITGKSPTSFKNNLRFGLI